MSKKLILFGAVTVLATGMANAQAKLVEKVTKQGDAIVIPYEKYTLPNGLTLIVTEDHSDPVVHLDVTYHVGSAREEIGKSGFAHFFEHMMFQGSDNVGDEQHFKIVTEAGGTLNGSTNTDRTNYYETVPSNQLEKVLWLEADRMGFLLDAVTQKKFEVQRETVKNERGQNYDNRPYGLVSEVMSKNLYPYGHPYSWLTIGYIEDLNRGNADDLKNFFLRWYGPNNATVTVGGDVKTADVLKLVEKYFGSIPAGPKVTNMAPTVPMLDKHRFASYVDNYARLPLMMQTYPTVPMYHPDMAPLACLAQILGQGNNSILYQQLTKKQLALQASCFSSQQELSGGFNFQIIPFPGKSLSSMFYLLNNALDSFEARGVTDDDIAKFKGGYESQMINSLQSVSGKVSQLAAFQTFAGNPNMIGKLMTMYQSVTKADVMRVYNQYIRNRHPLTVSVLPKNQENMKVGDDNFVIDTTKYKAPDYGYAGLKYTKAKDNFDRKAMPANGANPVVKVPAFWREDWPSGIKLIGAETSELPTVTLSIKIPGGRLVEADNLQKVGIASMFSDMMGDDTKSYTAEDFSKELQKLGSSVNVFTDEDNTTFSVSTQKKNLDATLKLLQERMFNPSFKQDALDRFKKQTLESLKLSKTQPASVASEVFAKLNYGRDNILGMDMSGTEASVTSFTLADIQQYYDTYMTRKGTQVVVVGDISEADILPKLQFLNNLPDKDVKIPKIASAPKVDKMKIYLVDVPKAAQTEFRVGYVTDLKYDAMGEYYKTGLMNYALGGAFNSRLNLNLREDKGWTYGARSGFSGSKQTGDFEFSSGIRANATDSAMIEVIKELTSYGKDGITDQELTFMKSAVGQRDALMYETGFQKANFIGRILENNLPADFTDQQTRVLTSLTKEEVSTLAKKYIDTGKMNVLLVGDKQKILPGLEKLGYEIIELDAEGNPVQKKAF